MTGATHLPRQNANYMLYRQGGNARQSIGCK